MPTRLLYVRSSFPLLQNQATPITAIPKEVESETREQSPKWHTSNPFEFNLPWKQKSRHSRAVTQQHTALQRSCTAAMLVALPASPHPPLSAFRTTSMPFCNVWLSDRFSNHHWGVCAPLVLKDPLPPPLPPRCLTLIVWTVLLHILLSWVGLVGHRFCPPRNVCRLSKSVFRQSKRVSNILKQTVHFALHLSRRLTK